MIKFDQEIKFDQGDQIRSKWLNWIKLIKFVHTDYNDQTDWFDQTLVCLVSLINLIILINLINPPNFSINHLWESHWAYVSNLVQIQPVVAGEKNFTGGWVGGWWLIDNKANSVQLHCNCQLELSLANILTKYPPIIPL